MGSWWPNAAAALSWADSARFTRLLLSLPIVCGALGPSTGFRTIPVPGPEADPRSLRCTVSRIGRPLWHPPGYSGQGTPESCRRRGCPGPAGLGIYPTLSNLTFHTLPELWVNPAISPAEFRKKVTQFPPAPNPSWKTGTEVPPPDLPVHEEEAPAFETSLVFHARLLAPIATDIRFYDSDEARPTKEQRRKVIPSPECRRFMAWSGGSSPTELSLRPPPRAENPICPREGAPHPAPSRKKQPHGCEDTNGLSR